MIHNYIKTALQNILRNKLYSGINILGLTLGLAVGTELRRSCFAMLLLIPNLRLGARLSSSGYRTKLASTPSNINRPTSTA
jgi:hypothetical protein